MNKQTTYQRFFTCLLEGGNNSGVAGQLFYPSFLSFILRDAANRSFLSGILVCTAIEFFLFKLCYPFPDFFSDSYSYIFAAYANMDINIWPIGYSKFLRSFHVMTSSASALVWFQFLFFEISCLMLYFAINYYFGLRIRFKQILTLFLFFNPLFLYLANYVSSDTLFISLSIIWIVQLLFILNRPMWYHIPLQAILLFLCFTVRFNAMVYPLIAALVFAIARFNIVWKIAGILAGPALIIPFIIHSRTVAAHLTGAAQFPMLSGWQWANNALYMRGHITVDPNTWSEPELRELDRISEHFFRNTPPEKRNLSAYVANYFIRKKNAPLKVYMDRHVKTENFYQYLLGWGKVSPVYREYGLTLIKQQPAAYFWYFIAMNAKNYFYPPLEVLSLYNLGSPKIYPFAVDWFQLKTTEARSVSKYLQGVVLLIFPFLFLLLNVYYIVTLILLRHQHALAFLPKSSVIISLLLLLNFLFSISANIIVIRYQIFPMILLLTLGLLNTELLLQKIKQGNKIKPNQFKDMIPAELIVQ